MSTNWKQKSLTPVLLKESDPSYKTVDDLLHAIEDEHILNIAVTGPYGSGKSSVLNTLMEKAPKDAIFLDISLATLDADDSLKEGESPEIHNNDILNRKIEYSILQQLVYRETLHTLPFSRLKKIRHLSADTIKSITGYILGLFTCICFAFTPSLLLIDEVYSAFRIPDSMQQAIRIIAVIFILIMLYEVITHIIQIFGGMRIGHVNVGGNEIDMADEGSIFNRYLDEILYFFQCTDYNVVIIEDLDRFNTTDIFLKLRELNHLINKSKIVNRKIRFIYAVKDDMFKDASRSKFFDYITTVIPVITTSNSKDKLREALSELGHKDEVPNESIRDIAFHIDDMRLLYNIANEYHQYSVRLNNDKDHSLDSAKMLAMIAVKNYHPHDFSLLHKRDGKIYKAISKEAKRLYVKTAIEQKILNREQLCKKNIDVFDNTSHISASELRLIYLMRIISHIGHNVVNVVINGQNRTFLQIANSEEDFNTIIKEGIINYHYLHYASHYSDSFSFNFSKIEKEVNSEFTFEERMNSLHEGRQQLLQELQYIEMEKARVHTYTVKELLMKFNLYEDEYFRSLELSPMEEDFIRNGLIDEDYNDYISYFYPGMMSLSDHQLCLDMRLDRNPSYDSQIDDCEILLAELPDSAFQYKSVLNITLLDFLAQHYVVYKRKYDLMIDLLLSKHPTDFLVSYIAEGNNVNRVWNSMMDANADTLWINSGSGTADENIVLYRQWILHCQKKHITKPQIIWINNHYDDIAICYPQLAKDIQDYFASHFLYKELTETSHDMLSAVIDNQCYVVNDHNMPYVVSELCAVDDITKLATLDEKRLALSLDLVEPSWTNINAYYIAKDRSVDGTLLDFIGLHLSAINECSEVDGEESLFQSLLENSRWDDLQYERICSLSPFYVDLTSEVLKLPDSKLSTLIQTESIEASVVNFTLLASNSVKASISFIKHNRTKFKEYIDAIELEAKHATAILTDTAFNQNEYEYVISRLSSSAVTMDPSLAEAICLILSTHYAKCDTSILVESVKLCSNKNSAVQTASHAIGALKDEDITTELLSALGDKYGRLTDFHISETFEDTPANQSLASVLQNSGYISSYSMKDGKLKMNTKNSR
ncbi:MAG: hypothetical protein KBS80_05045 [Bacteroidales bacterium]|nr:hypothetical protein [Candidatus Cryptobacteroides choladohippi]